MTDRFPNLISDSLPGTMDTGGAWLVERVTSGWVKCLSANMKYTLRLSVKRFNEIASEIQAARNE